MTTLFLACDTAHRLCAVDAEAEEYLRRQVPGELLRVDVKKPRNVLHHRRLMAMFRLVAENCDEFESVDHARHRCLCDIGYCDTRVVSAGEESYEYRIPWSMAFDQMDQAQAQAMDPLVVDWVAEQLHDAPENVQRIVEGFMC